MLQVEKYLQEFTDGMIKDLPGAISISIVDLLDGNVLAYSSNDLQADNKEVSSYQADVVKFALKGMNYIDHLNTDKFKDITITLDHQTHIIYTTERQRLIVHVIMEKEGANLALAEILKKKLYNEVVSKLQAEASSPEEINTHPLLKAVDIFGEIPDNLSDSNHKDGGNGGFFRKLFSNN